MSVKLDIGLLAKLSNAFGPPGNEEEVRETLRDSLNKHADDVRVDRLGNIFFHHHGEKSQPTVMLAAHMDEVGFLVTFIEEAGFLRFQTLGGIVHSSLPGHLILLKGNKGDIKGVIGTKPPHLMTNEEKKKITPIEDLFIDIGSSSSVDTEEKGIEVGAIGVFDVRFEELGQGYLRGKAFDDRIGCFVMIEVFKALVHSPLNIVAVGTVQEEVGLRGAKTAAWQLDLDYGLALEGTFAADIPGSRADRVSSKLLEGPVVSIVDRTTITHPSVLKGLMSVGKQKSIPFQFKKVPMGGTDAGAIHVSKSGVPSGTVAVPCRYIHGSSSVAHVQDVQSTVSLVTEFVNSLAT